MSITELEPVLYSLQSVGHGMKRPSPSSSPEIQEILKNASPLGKRVKFKFGGGESDDDDKKDEQLLAEATGGEKEAKAGNKRDDVNTTAINLCLDYNYAGRSAGSKHGCSLDVKYSLLKFDANSTSSTCYERDFLAPSSKFGLFGYPRNAGIPAPVNSARANRNTSLAPECQAPPTSHTNSDFMFPIIKATTNSNHMPTTAHHINGDFLTARKVLCCKSPSADDTSSGYCTAPINTNNDFRFPSARNDAPQALRAPIACHVNGDSSSSMNPSGHGNTQTLGWKNFVERSSSRMLLDQLDKLLKFEDDQVIPDLNHNSNSISLNSHSGVYTFLPFGLKNEGHGSTDYRRDLGDLGAPKECRPQKSCTLGHNIVQCVNYLPTYNSHGKAQTTLAQALCDQSRTEDITYSIPGVYRNTDIEQADMALFHSKGTTETPAVGITDRNKNHSSDLWRHLTELKITSEHYSRIPPMIPQLSRGIQDAAQAQLHHRAFSSSYQCNSYNQSKFSMSSSHFKKSTFAHNNLSQLCRSLDHDYHSHSDLSKSSKSKSQSKLSECSNHNNQPSCSGCKHLHKLSRHTYSQSQTHRNQMGAQGQDLPNNPMPYALQRVKPPSSTREGSSLLRFNHELLAKNLRRRYGEDPFDSTDLKITKKAMGLFMEQCAPVTQATNRTYHYSSTVPPEVPPSLHHLQRCKLSSVIAFILFILFALHLYPSSRRKISSA